MTVLKVLVASTLMVISMYSYSQGSSVEGFVDTVYFRGVPYEDALELKSKENIEILKNILISEDKSSMWANAIVTLEIVGSNSELPFIINFLEKDHGIDYSGNLFSAKSAGIYGLGYFINHNKSKKAERYLEAGLTTDSWKGEKFGVFKNGSGGYSRKNSEMGKYAILALALSGEDSSRAIIKNISKDESKRSKLHPNARKLLGMAEKENLKIGRQGMSKYELHKR